MKYIGDSFFDNLEITNQLPKLITHQTCDFLIIGAGISGLICAYELQKMGKKIIIVEKNDIGSGSSKLSTGLVQYSNDKMFYQMKNDDSINANHFFEECIDASNEVKNMVEKHQLDIDYRECESLYLCSEPNDQTKLEQEYHFLIQKKQPVTFLTKEQLEKQFQIKKPCALLTNDISLNPYKLCLRLSNLLQTLSVDIYQSTYFSSKNGIAYFKNNVQIQYQHIILCMGYDNIKENNIKDLVKNVTYVIIPQEKISLPTGDRMVWETSRPYLYINIIDDTILIGGMDEKYPKGFHNTETYFHKLEQKFTNLFSLPKLTFQTTYASSFFTTHSGLPKLIQKENKHYIYPYGGNGLIHAIILAKRLKKSLEII